MWVYHVRRNETRTLCVGAIVGLIRWTMMMVIMMMMVMLEMMMIVMVMMVMMRII